MTHEQLTQLNIAKMMLHLAVDEPAVGLMDKNDLVWAALGYIQAVSDNNPKVDLLSNEIYQELKDKTGIEIFIRKINESRNAI